MKYYEEMEDLKDTLEQARLEGDPKAEASALYGIGRIYLKEDFQEEAGEFWTQCVAVCRESGQVKELAQVLKDLGDLALKKQDFAGAGGFYTEALGIHESLEDSSGRARIFERLGSLATEAGDPAKALEEYARGLELCEESEDNIGSLFFLDQMIPHLRSMNRIPEVRERYRRSVTLAEKIGDRQRMALGLVGLADTFTKAGQEKEATPYLTLAHDILMHAGRLDEAGLVKKELERIGGLVESLEAIAGRPDETG